MKDLEEAFDHELLAVDESRELDGRWTVEVELGAGKRVRHVALATFGADEVHAQRLEVHPTFGEIPASKPPIESPSTDSCPSSAMSLACPFIST